MESKAQGSPEQSNRATPETRPVRRTEDVVYQVVTICAILLVLGSLWAF